MTILSLGTSCREAQNFAEEERKIEVIEEPTVQLGKDSILTFKFFILKKNKRNHVS